MTRKKDKVKKKKKVAREYDDKKKWCTKALTPSFATQFEWVFKF